MDENKFSILAFVFFILCLIGVIFFSLFGKFSSLGKGEHSGFITAVDQRGYIFRNYEIYFKTDNSSSQEDIYCIHRNDAVLIEKAKEANQARKQVTVHYKGVRGIGLGLCDNAQITDIK